MPAHDLTGQRPEGQSADLWAENCRLRTLLRQAVPLVAVAQGRSASSETRDKAHEWLARARAELGEPPPASRGHPGR